MYKLVWQRSHINSSETNRGFLILKHCFHSAAVECYPASSTHCTASHGNATNYFGGAFYATVELPGADNPYNLEPLEILQNDCIIATRVWHISRKMAAAHNSGISKKYDVQSGHSDPHT